jgi:hypothetical protein
MLRLGHTIGIVGWLAGTAWLVDAAPLWAEPPHASKQDAGRANETLTQYTFDDELVNGDDVSPTLEVLHVRKQRRGDSLVRARTSFVDHMLKSIEDL